MIIAHFVNFTPRLSGLYETAREICEAECHLKHVAKLVDTSWVHTNSPPPITFKYDRGVDIATMEWAKKADIHVLHSIIPKPLLGTKPTVLVLHGTPEYTFFSELMNHKHGDRSFSTLMMYSKMPFIHKYITFWQRHIDYWKPIFGNKVVYCPPPINLDDYTLHGPKHQLTNVGKINIGYCDTWHSILFKNPLQIIAGLYKFVTKHKDINIKLHLFGIPGESKRIDEWGGIWDKYLSLMKQYDFIGDLQPTHENMAEIYRALDIIITSSSDINRITRESMACGTPVIGPIGNEAAYKTCNIINPEEVNVTLEKLIQELRINKDRIKTDCVNKVRQFSVIKSTKAFLDILMLVKNIRE